MQKGGKGGRSLKLNENLDSGIKGYRRVLNTNESPKRSNYGTRLCGCVILQSLTTQTEKPRSSDSVLRQNIPPPPYHCLDYYLLKWFGCYDMQ